MHHECSHYTNTSKRERERVLPTPKMRFKQQPSLYRSIFTTSGYFLVTQKDIVRSIDPTPENREKKKKKTWKARGQPSHGALQARRKKIAVVWYIGGPYLK